MNSAWRSAILCVCAGVLQPGCTSLYYKSMEKIGKEKRDILVKRIEDGRKDQEEAKEQFQTTLQAFQALTGFDGGDLEKTYNKLAEELKASEDRAKDLSDRIKSIDRVAADLFTEWQSELDSMRDRELKARSLSILRDTQRKEKQLIAKMKGVERRMHPVLQKFRDKVFFLKHNLNAKAISSLKKTTIEMDTDVSALVKDIEDSIREADRFIATLDSDE